jgi:hypothetical protein
MICLKKKTPTSNEDSLKGTSMRTPRTMFDTNLSFIRDMKYTDETIST